jgi:hypothetical protein
MDTLMFTLMSGDEQNNIVWWLGMLWKIILRMCNVDHHFLPGFCIEDTRNSRHIELDFQIQNIVWRRNRCLDWNVLNIQDFKKRLSWLSLVKKCNQNVQSDKWLIGWKAARNRKVSWKLLFRSQAHKKLELFLMANSSQLSKTTATACSRRMYIFYTFKYLISFPNLLGTQFKFDRWLFLRIRPHMKLSIMAFTLGWCFCVQFVHFFLICEHARCETIPFSPTGKIFYEARSIDRKDRVSWVEGSSHKWSSSRRIIENVFFSS